MSAFLSKVAALSPSSGAKAMPMLAVAATSCPPIVCALAERPQDARSEDPRVGGIRVAAVDQSELVAAEPAEHPSGLDRGPEHLGHPTQHLVAGLGREDVVDVPEAVDVQDQNRDAPAALRELVLEELREVAAVRSAGEGVESREADEPLLGVILAGQAHLGTATASPLFPDEAERHERHHHRRQARDGRELSHHPGGDRDVRVGREKGRRDVEEDQARQDHERERQRNGLYAPEGRPH